MVPEITWQVWLIAVCVITVGSFFQGIIGYGVAIFSALMGTITGVGGPPIGLAYQNASPRRIVGSLSAIFVPTSLMSLTALWFLGRFQLSDVVLALSLLPGMLGGFWLSSRITGMRGQRIPVPVYKWLMLSVAALASVYTILREIIMV